MLSAVNFSSVCMCVWFSLTLLLSKSLIAELHSSNFDSASISFIFHREDRMIFQKLDMLLCYLKAINLSSSSLECRIRSLLWSVLWFATLTPFLFLEWSDSLPASEVLVGHLPYLQVSSWTSSIESYPRSISLMSQCTL